MSITWKNAEIVAENMRYMGHKGHLATLTTAAENAFVTKHFPGDSRISNWLGGYQDADRNWHWVTGEPWEFTDWHPGEPNAHSDSALQVLNMYPEGGWNDTNNDDGHGCGFIVEFER